MTRIGTTLEGLYELRRRLDDKQLEPDDWPLVQALVTQKINRVEAQQERMLRKMAAAAAAAEDDAKADPDVDGSVPNDESEGGSASGGIRQADSGSGTEAPSTGDDPQRKPEKPGQRKKGHGRNGVSAYRNANHLFHVLKDGVLGGLCPKCGLSKVYRKREKVIIHILGQPLINADVHHYEEGRCRNCGHVERADGPAEVHEGLGTDYIRYDWSACGMLLVIHYSAGMPFKRLESLQEGWGIPIPDANQWQVVDAADDLLLPLYKALEQHAIAKATNFRTDDTGSMVVELQKQIDAELAALERLGESTSNVRTGINATGFYWETPDGPVILYYTGRHHAGEMVDQLLRRRLLSEPKLVKCTDGASKNFSHEQGAKLVEAACNAHAFLKFREVRDKYPAEYAEAGRIYKHVFDNDDKAKALGLTPIDRMLFHRKHSKPLMEKLKAMCVEKLQSKLVEPNSPLWEPLTFIINQWERLTQFYEAPNVPLDTNLVEQVLIMAVRYLAGSFNYKTEDGATVGDHAMSLIATARANGVEPVAYLSECLRNHEALASRPEHYLPWVYRERVVVEDSLQEPARAPPQPESEPSPARGEPEDYATLRQRSGNAQAAGSPPHNSTCSSRASRGEQGFVPSPVGHAEKRPLDKRFVHSQNPAPS